MTVPVIEKGKSLSFRYGDERITFTRVPRHTKSDAILIKVHPTCKVVVAAPEDASDESVLAAAKKRQRWICRKLLEFREQQSRVMPRSYNSGESHYYLGKQYQLKVLSVRDKEPGVKLMRGNLEARVDTKEPKIIQKALAQWYRSRADSVFRHRLDAILGQALWVAEKPPLQIRSMKTQWGSCSPSGRILLNLHLVKAHRDCIDYVILHELCHLVEHNHSKRFYRLMSQVMPTWEDTKIRLDSQASRFLS